MNENESKSVDFITFLMGFYCFLSEHYFEEKLHCGHRRRHDDSGKNVI